MHKYYHKKADGRDLWLYFEGPFEAQYIREADRAEKLAKQQTAQRYHPLRDEWNIYAGHRQNRAFKPDTANDPLAPSKLGHPPTEIPYDYFELAIFENKWPSLKLETSEIMANIPGLQTKSAIGRCEVVVYTPEQEGSLATLTQKRRELLIDALCDRYSDLFDLGLSYIHPFENRGDAVGVTLHHPHGQIYGFKDTPNVQVKMQKAFEGGYNLYEHLSEWHKTYQIADYDGFVGLAPPFARFPYEVWLIPSSPHKGPWELSASDRASLAAALGDMTARYDAYFGEPTPYMMSFQAAPKEAKSWQFSVQFYPLLRAPGRLKYLASIEQSTGVFTVDVVPEEAANALKNIKV